MTLTFRWCVSTKKCSIYWKHLGVHTEEVHSQTKILMKLQKIVEIEEKKREKTYKYFENSDQWTPVYISVHLFPFAALLTVISVQNFTLGKALKSAALQSS